MTPELEKFIHLATRPLEDRPELREEARGELMGRLSHRGVPLEMIDVAGPTGRLEAAKPVPAKLRRGLVLGTLVVRLGLFVLGVWRDGAMLCRAIYSTNLSWRTRTDSFAPSGRWDAFFYRWLDRRAPDLPFSGRQGEIANLRRDHPEDLAILQEALARRSIKEARFMTPQERSLVERLDSDNALWPMMEMWWEFHKASGTEPFGGYFFGSSGTADPSAVERAWERHAEAAALDRFHSYGGLLAKRQEEAFGEDHTVLEGMIRSELVGMPRATPDRMMMYFGRGPGGSDDSLRMRISDLEKRGQGEALQGLFDDWKKLQRLIVAPEHPDAWAVMTFTQTAAEDAQLFRKVFASLGLSEEEEEAKGIAGKLSLHSPAPYSGADAEAGMRLQSGRWSDVPVTPGEMRPGRKADMAMFHRMLAWPLVLIALVFVLMWGFEACRRNEAVKGTARGLVPLFGLRDHLYIGVSGLVVPWLYWWAVTRLTPVGLSDKVFEDEWDALGWVLQIAIGMSLGLVMLTQAVQWRWSKIGAFLGMAGPAPWLGRVVAWLVAAALPGAGLVRHLPLASDEDKGYYMMGCAAMGSLGLLWLLWVGIMNVCTPREGALRPNLVARTMIPWSLAGLASLLLAVGVLRLAEGWWYARDPLLPGGTSEHYANALEERGVMRQVAPLREAFGVALSGAP